MLNFFYISIFAFAHPAFSFNPKEMDYCGFDCSSGGRGAHAACKCHRKNDDRVERTENMYIFRQTVVHHHNLLRNMFACSEENRTLYTYYNVSNMRVINYDIELEYIARCYALGKFPHGDLSGGTPHSLCNNPLKGVPKGQTQGAIQNVFFDSRPKRFFTIQGINDWYDEVVYITENLTDSFNNKSRLPDKSIEHFSAMIWADVTHVGCVRLNFRKGYKNFNIFLICNYKTPVGVPAPNTIGSPVLLKGEQCSKCPKGTKCETSMYPCLCGKLEKVPNSVVIKVSSTTRQTCICIWSFLFVPVANRFLFNYVALPVLHIGMLIAITNF